MKVTYDAEAAKAYGIPAAVLLAKVAYYSRYTKKPGGWCWKSVGDLEEETGLTRHQQAAAVEKLTAAGLIETRSGRVRGHRGPVRHYRLTEAGAALCRAEKRLNVQPKSGSTNPVVEPEKGSTINRINIYRNNTRASSGPGGAGRAARGRKEQQEREAALEAQWAKEWEERKKAAGLEVLEGGRE